MTQRKSKPADQAKDLLGCGIWVTFLLLGPLLYVGFVVLWNKPLSIANLMALVLIVVLGFVWSKVYE